MLYVSYQGPSPAVCGNLGQRQDAAQLAVQLREEVGRAREGAALVQRLRRQCAAGL